MSADVFAKVSYFFLQVDQLCDKRDHVVDAATITTKMTSAGPQIPPILVFWKTKPANATQQWIIKIVWYYASERLLLIVDRWVFISIPHQQYSSDAKKTT